MRALKIVLLALAACGGAPRSAPAAQQYDVVIRNGTVYDGSGHAPVIADVAIASDRIAAIGDLHRAHARTEIDAHGLAVAPGFINMLSSANESLFDVPHADSDIYQGITLDVFGEGRSMGPLNDWLIANFVRDKRRPPDASWRTLDEGLTTLERHGVSVNIASMVGATNVRWVVMGDAPRAATPEEIEKMRMLVDQAMREGALGVGAGIFYVPATFATTDELVVMAEVSAKYGGMFIAHMRSEGTKLLEAIDEMIEIARRSHVRTEIYHLKAAGKPNWDKMDAAIAKIEAARAEGLPLTANMYPYAAAWTGLPPGTIPTWARAGEKDERLARLRDPEIRKRIVEELKNADGNTIKISSAKTTKDAIGKTVSEIATQRGVSVADAIIDLVLENDETITAVFFAMSEDNVRRVARLPWVSFGTDGMAVSPTIKTIIDVPPPRFYGTFPRVLAKYVREEKLFPLEEAIRRMTSLPATNLRIEGRGALVVGNYADVVVFDPIKIADLATYDEPQQLSVGMVHVFVNGVQVLRNGAHTGATPGRVVRGPGWDKKTSPTQPRSQ